MAIVLSSEMPSPTDLGPAFDEWSGSPLWIAVLGVAQPPFQLQRALTVRYRKHEW